MIDVTHASAPPARATDDSARPKARRSTQSWRPIPRSRTYSYVIDQVDEQIVSGALGVGDRLPPERDLASMLGVGRGAVREAMRVLEAYGVVRTETGTERGTTLTAMPSEALTQILRLHIGLANFPMADVIEARVMLERWSARLAARHGTTADLEAIATELRQMEGLAGDREAFNEHDTAFHVAIARASNNRLVADMTTAIRDSMRSLVLDSFHSYEEWGGLSGELCAQHRRVYDAIAAGDADAAADAVEHHIRSAYQTLDWGRV
jgi:GntR family transcriptional repressor for pyruvate dehydrogenase complex